MKSCTIYSILLIVWCCSLFSGIGYTYPAQSLEGRGFFDSLNVSLEGIWPFTWATEVEGDSLRKLAFLGCGGGVFILDVSDSSNPQVISDKITARDIIRDCYYSYDDQRLYVAAGYDGMQVWSIADPVNPAKILSYETRGPAHGIFALNNYVYVACFDSGLSIVDVSNPNSPYEIGHLTARTRTYKIKVVGDYAYLGEAFGGIFRVINVSNPGAPYEVGYCHPNCSKVDGVEVFGGYAFLACNDGGFKVIDVLDPSNPVVVDTLSTLSLTMGIALSGDRQYAYTAERNAGIRVINISDPTNVYTEGVLSLSPYYVFDVAAYGRTVLAAAAIFAVVNASNPSAPWLIGLNRYPPGNHQVIRTQGNYLYIGTQGSLRILDITDVLNPTEVGVYLLPQRDTNLKGLDVSGNYVFLGRSDGVFQILDITDPTNPRPLGSYSPCGTIEDLVVSGDYCYMVDYNSYDLTIMDISDVNNPTLIATFTLPDYNSSGIMVLGNYAYIANQFDGLYIVDITDPSNPFLVSQFNPGPGFARQLDISGDYCYLTKSPYGVKIIDISNPNNPFLVGEYGTFDSWDVVYREGTIYVTDGTRGVKMADVTDPANPVEIGYYNSSYDSVKFARKLTMNDSFPGYFFVVYYRKGLHIYKNLLYAVEEKKTALDIDGENIITVLPNPASKRVIFNIPPMKGTGFLEIFDSAGRFVRRLTIPENQRQHTEVIWNGRDEKGNKVRSGVYFGKSGGTTVKFLFVR